MKQISRKAHVWSHVGVILFHVLIGFTLILTQRKPKLWNIESSKWVKFIACVLIVFSLLSLIPILGKDEDICIQN